MSKRIVLLVEVDLDPVPGTFHTAVSARDTVSRLLKVIGHYHPTVQISALDPMDDDEIEFVDVNDPERGLVAFLQGLQSDVNANFLRDVEQDVLDEPHPFCNACGQHHVVDDCDLNEAMSDKAAEAIFDLMQLDAELRGLDEI